MGLTAEALGVAALEALHGDQIIALTQFLNTIGHFTEVVAVIDITHDDAIAPRTGKPSVPRRNLAPGRDCDLSEVFEIVPPEGIILGE